MTRLRRTNPSQPGFTRRRRGRGWQYLDADGAHVREQETIARIESLAIPPAWRDVWICPYPNGHLQAVGTDDAGRRQYLYHPDWQSARHRVKFERVTTFGSVLPSAREIVAEHLAEDEPTRERALATAFRLLDRGHFRIGGEVYAQTNGSFGLATLRREHVRIHRGDLVFDYVAKSGVRQVERLTDPELLAAITAMRRRRGGFPELLAYRSGRRWQNLTSTDINAYLKEVLAEDVSAKDFRTWHGTVLAAVALADELRSHDPARRWSQRAIDRARRTAVCRVADVLGNTPTVCRGSYIAPQVLDSFDRQVTIAEATAQARADLGRVDPEADPAELLVAVAGSPVVEAAVLEMLRP